MADTKISGIAATVVKKDLLAQDYVAVSRAGSTNAKFDLEELLNKDRSDLRDFPDFDPTGQTNMQTSVNAWQTQARTAGRIAYAPPGVYGLGSKAIFRAATICAGGGMFQQAGQPAMPPTDGKVPYTCFKNLGINDNSWMIDVESSGGESFGGNFGVLKGFRLHAGGWNCSLLRVLGVESITEGATPHNAFEKFVWEDILAYGGWVNLEHYGYSGVISNVYSRAAKLSAFRAYLCNALRVDGGWYSGTGPTAWAFEVFGRQAQFLTESSHGIMFNQPVFQDQDGARVSNGLRISEGIKNVKIAAYFEDHKQDGSGNGGVSLQVGWNKAGHPSPLIPTAVDITDSEKDAPTNYVGYAARGIDLSGSTGGGTYSATSGAKFQFNNVNGIKWGGFVTGARRVEYTRYTHDIQDSPRGLGQRSTTVSGLNGVNITNSMAAGTKVAETIYTTRFGVGQPVYLTLGLVSGKKYMHETTVESIDPGVSVTLTDPVPVGRTVAAGSLMGRNKADQTLLSAVPIDELNRGGDAPVNLLPAGNFRGTISDPLLGGYIHGVREVVVPFSDGRATVETDYAVRRGGRPTLKFTRKGTVVGGNQESKFLLIPHGSEELLQIGVPIVIAGWMLVENVVPYNSTDFSSGLTYDQPYVGLAFYNSAGEQRSVFSTYTGGGQYGKPGTWWPFQIAYTLNDPTVTKLGLAFYPTISIGYVWSTDASVWYDSLGIFVNPSSYEDIAKGKYTHSPAAGHFDVGGVFECSASAVPTGANVRIIKGDTFNNTAPDAGGFDKWRCVATGTGVTASVKQTGVIEA